MKDMIDQVKKFFKKVSCFFPTPLPIGMVDFGLWADSIIDVYGLPNNDSVRFALATMILHADSKKAAISKRYFGLCALKSMSNQIASGIMHELKEKQKKEAELQAAEEVKKNGLPQ